MAPSVTPVMRTIGGVRSIEIPVAVAVAPLPAWSNASPLDDWPGPSADRTCGAAHVSIPDNASAQVKASVTGPLFQPAAFAAGETDAVMAGAVRSMRSERDFAVSTLPALSVAK